MGSASVWDEYEGDSSSRAASGLALVPPRFCPAQLPDPATIPPRPWLYSTRLLRGQVTVLVAPGGVGKSAYAVGVILSLALRRALLKEFVHQRARCLWLCEDPLDEMNRRIAAAMLHHGIQREEIDGWMFAESFRTRDLVVAQTDEFGSTVIFPHKDALIQAIHDDGIGYLNVDPVVKAVRVEENSNPQMEAAAKAWVDVAEQTGCAIELLHHTKKGGGIGIDAARGASSLVNAARVGEVMRRMTVEEAKAFGVDADAAWSYIRIDDPKTNLAPPTHARWYHLASVALGNGTPDYPHGDHVGAMERWTPTSPWAGLAIPAVVKILEQIDHGPGDGARYTKSARGDSNKRWAGIPIMQTGDRNEQQARMLIKAWLDPKNGVLFESKYHDTNQRKEVECVEVNPEKLGEFRAQAVVFGAPDDC